MAKYISNRQRNLKIGIASYTEDKTVLEVTGNVGIKTADTQGYELYVNGDANISGIVSASSFRGDGSQLTGVTATSSLLISANTDNQSQYLTYVTGTGSTTGFGITTTGLVFNPSTGNLGIGTTNPTSKLHVVGNVYVSGNLGVGVTAPAFKADIAGDVRVTSENKMRFGGTAGTTNFYIQHNSTTNSMDFVAG